MFDLDNTTTVVVITVAQQNLTNSKHYVKGHHHPFIKIQTVSSTVLSRALTELVGGDDRVVSPVLLLSFEGNTELPGAMLLDDLRLLPVVPLAVERKNFFILPNSLLFASPFMTPSSVGLFTSTM